MASSLARSFLGARRGTTPVAEVDLRTETEGAPDEPPERSDRIDAAAIDEALARQLAAGAAAWPGVSVPALEVVALFAARVAGTCSDLPTAIQQLRGADLYIACGCGRADPAALLAFEARFFNNLAAVLSRVASPSDVTEITQILREKLFAPRPDEPPRIVEMAGRGDLGGLVRVAAIRIALNLRRSEHRLERIVDRAELDVLAPRDDPEIIAIRDQHRALFKQAIEHAISTLPIRDRSVLRMHLLDGLSIDDIGRAYQVHRATAARWLDRIRDDLRVATFRHLRDRLGGSSAELDSLVRVFDSRLDVSFHGLLRSSPSA